MSIESHAWHREAFTLTCTDTAWTVKRRAFPPRLDPARDRTNVEAQTHYYDSLIRLFERQNPMQFCAGVNGFFVRQQVNFILLTDGLYAKELTFVTAVASCAVLHQPSGQELVAFDAYLYDGKIDRVACRQGVLCQMEINILIMAHLVVLHECSVKQVIIDPLLFTGPLRSRAVFEGKILCNDLIINSKEPYFPKLFLSETSKKPHMEFAPIFLPHRVFKESIQLHQDKAVPDFNRWIEANKACASHPDIDRGAVWGLGLFDPSRTNNPDDDQECPVCREKLASKQKVFGHFAPTTSTKDLVHYCCASCFPLLTIAIVDLRRTKACPICRTTFVTTLSMNGPEGFETTGLSTVCKLIPEIEIFYKMMLKKYRELA